MIDYPAETFINQNGLEIGTQCPERKLVSPEYYTQKKVFKLKEK